MSNFAPPANGNLTAESNTTPINGSTIDSSFPPAASLPQGSESSKTLWMGELEPWMDENFVKNVFSTVSGENVNVKVIRDRASGNAGYCFVEFNTVEAATKALSLNGSNIPNSSRAFKLNWASGGGLVDRR